MGQRGNYIIQSAGQFKIFYTHWRANLIAHDLLQGPKKYLAFVRQFEQRKELVNDPWIEGCVWVDLDAKTLLFWEIEQLLEYSVREAYLKILQDKWKGWKVSFAEKEMYDIEKLLGIDYTSCQ